MKKKEITIKGSSVRLNTNYKFALNGKYLENIVNEALGSVNDEGELEGFDSIVDIEIKITPVDTDLKVIKGE